MAETITNNVRRVIVDERPVNPRYFDRMSELLDAILDERRQSAIDYQEYLARLVELAGKVGRGESDTEYPDWASNHARRARFDFFDNDEGLAGKVDSAVMSSKYDSWVGDAMKEKIVRRAIEAELPDGFENAYELFDLVKARQPRTRNQTRRLPGVHRRARNGAPRRRNHGSRFTNLMDQLLPDWRSRRDQLYPIDAGA